MLLRPRRLLLAVLSAAPFILVALAPSKDPEVVRTSRAQEPLRCNPSAHREIEPLVLEEGGTFDIRVAFGYACSDENRQIVFFLAIENSDKIQPSGFFGRRLIDNVREGLTAFVDEGARPRRAPPMQSRRPRRF